MTTDAFTACREFNAAYPNGAAGVVKLDNGQWIETTLESRALTFPDPENKTEVTMAWFRDVGWRNIQDFVQQERVHTISEELHMIGLQMASGHKTELAQALFTAAITVDPENWKARNDFALRLSSQYDFLGAIKQFDLGLITNPNSGELHINRAVSRRAIGAARLALEDCKKANRLLPGNDAVALTTSAVLCDLNCIDEALEVLKDGIARNSTNITFFYNRAQINLTGGKFYDGWRDLACRFSQPAVSTHYEHFDAPQWREGDSLQDQNILVWCDQGLGDEIMTSSMLQDAIDAAASVTFLCMERLVPIMRRSFPKAIVDHRPTAPILHSFQRRRLADQYLPEAVRGKTFDMQMSQSDLGLLFRPKLEAFPERMSFLRVERTPFDIGFLLRAERGGKKVIGISWNSAKNLNTGKMKGIDLKSLLPILQTPGITWVNLQYGDVADEIAELKKLGVDIVQTGVDPLKDMDAFFSLVAAMDLVVSVSNTTVHVAGALGIPCSVLCPTGPGKLWYWGMEGEKTPWYSSVRLFRQPRASHWEPVINGVAAELATWAKA